MATIKLVGVLTDVLPAKTTPNFSKKVFWLKEPDTERYPQHWALELHSHDIDRLNGLNLGDKLECECEVRGRKYTTRMMDQTIALTLKCTGILVLERLTTVPGKVGEYKPRTKPGREADNDRPKSQQELGL